MEWFFGSGEIWPKRPDVVEFIVILRYAGYDRLLRAGQSVDTFIVSRSRKHGLRPEQPSIGFNLRDGRIMVYSRGLESESFVQDAGVLSDQTRDLMERLTQEAIT